MVRCLRLVTKVFVSTRCGKTDGRVGRIHVVLLVVFVLSAALSLHVLIAEYLPQLYRRRHFDPRTDGGIRLMSYVDECNCGRDENCVSICSALQDNETRIWPSAHGSYSMSRLSEQIRFANQYGEWYNARQSTANYSKIKDKVILRIGTFNLADWIDGRERFIIDECPITDCLMTSDVASYRQTADVLVISEMDFTRLQQLKPKPRHQIWIAQHMEPPPQNRIDANYLYELVNWTASYRRDSTIPFPYYVINPRTTTEEHPPYNKPKNYAEGKTKQVAWFVSSCVDHNGRKGYVRELNKHIAVDIYGNGGWLECAHNDDNCWSMLKKTYKFYLAFENSNCWDYITEKLFKNALRNDVVPIVMGARPSDYADVAPPHSYIHVDDFRSPRHLADYLRVLDANETAYNEYFRWKSDWTITAETKYWCRMCALLHAATDLDLLPPYVHWYQDYGTWWNGVCDASWIMKDGVQYKTWQNTSHAS